MTMIYFNSDYTEGAHPAVMERLMQTNMEQTTGYGEDEYSLAAAEMIKRLCEAPEALVRFLVGGTQTNYTVIAAALRPHQGVIAADSGHISIHESGAIESTGHKVLALPNTNGKITAAQAEEMLRFHFSDPTQIHMVQPAMVYLSQPTETGTLYSLAELTAMRAVCDRYNAMLYIDGARLGYGMACKENDVTLPDLARLCDVFYIGGTKVGALFGEAVVVINEAIKRDFLYLIKQKGGLLAKGRLLGVQFDALFSGGLYWDISKHAVDMAQRVRAAFLAKGIPLYADSPSNQQFFILPDAVLAKLEEKYVFSFWSKTDAEHTAVRVCTSWATREQDIAALERDIAAL